VSYLSIAIVLAVLGLVLFLAEYFLPTGGILIVCGFLVSAGAVAVVAANTEDYRETIAAIVLLCIGEPIFAIAGMSLAGKRLALKAVVDETSDEAPATDAEASPLVGRYGVTVTPLRPSGAAEFDNRRVDVVSEGVPIDAGAWVKCIEAKGARVVVRAVPKPPDLGEIQIEDLK
jgi:membrane-bound ClpP family serine protease